MFDTREKCVNCLVDFTVFWGDVEKKTGKREHYATSKPAVHTKDGWLCAKCAEKGCMHISIPCFQGFAQVIKLRHQKYGMD